MKSRKVKDGYLLRLEKGELILEELKKFCTEKKISAGWITGLGGALWQKLLSII